MVDLSSLWAGPLCGQLLAAAGADVVKVESLARPDGARHGPGGLLRPHERPEAVGCPRPGDARGPVRPATAHRCGRCGDRERPPPGARADGDHGGRGAGPPGRAPGRSGCGRRSPATAGDRAGPSGWGSATWPPWPVAWWPVARWRDGLAGDGDAPCFLADAVADPLAGLVAAAAVLEALAAGGRWLLDVALAPLAAAVAGPALEVAGVPAAAATGAPGGPPGTAAGIGHGHGAGRARGVSSLVLRDAEVDGERVDVRVEEGLITAVGPRRGGAARGGRGDRVWRRRAAPRAARSPSPPALHGRGRRIGGRVGRSGRAPSGRPTRRPVPAPPSGPCATTRGATGPWTAGVSMRWPPAGRCGSSTGRAPCGS